MENGKQAPHSLSHRDNSRREVAVTRTLNEVIDTRTGQVIDPWKRIAELERELAALRPEVRLNPDGTLDEVCAPGFHLEMMDYNHWFLEVVQNGHAVAVWLHARGRIVANYERRLSHTSNGTSK